MKRVSLNLCRVNLKDSRSGLFNECYATVDPGETCQLPGEGQEPKSRPGTTTGRIPPTDLTKTTQGPQQTLGDHPDHRETGDHPDTTTNIFFSSPCTSSLDFRSKNFLVCTTLCGEERRSVA